MTDDPEPQSSDCAEAHCPHCCCQLNFASFGPGKVCPQCHGDLPDSWIASDVSESSWSPAKPEPEPQISGSASRFCPDCGFQMVICSFVRAVACPQCGGDLLRPSDVRRNS